MTTPVGGSSLPRRDVLLPLTSIRFFAAAFIVLYHLTGVWGVPSADAVGWHFGIGVDLFFVLSGFILGYTYRQVADVSGAVRLVLYRLARIVPLHWAMMIAWAFFAYVAFQPPPWSAETAAAFVLIQAWTPDFRVLFAGNSVSWTLSVELFFYLCLPVLLFVGSAGTVLIAAAITVLTLAWASVEGGMRADVIVLTSPGAFFVHFAVGMLLARLFVTRSWKIGKGPATALEIGAAGLALGYIFTNQQVAPVLAPLLHLDSYALSWIARTPAPIVFGALVLILAIGRGYLSDLLRQRPLVLLGEISFATYLVHMVLLRQMLRWSWLTLSPGLMIILYVILTYALSFLLYRFIEIPSNRWLRFKIDQLLPRQASAAA